MTVVRYAVLPAEAVFNLASPRYLPEVFARWSGAHDWHDARYEPLRDEIEAAYVDGFNEASKHYERLEASVLDEGFRNPIVVSAGKLDRRNPKELPPDQRNGEAVVCEYLGGSRLWVAKRHWLDVPCIVNDHANVLPEAEVLAGLGHVTAKFTDKPRAAKWSRHGVYLNNLPYMHLPEGERYGLAQQSRIRRGILEDVHEVVRRWLDAHD